MALQNGKPPISTGPATTAQIDPSVFAPKHDAGPAIVLSGGGAKGDFEVGAVRCLYNLGVRPKILCGTSVGAINALKLAEGEDTPAPAPAPAGHVRGLAGLEKIWLNLSNDAQMWSLEPGVAEVFNTLKNLPSDASALESQAGSIGSDSIGGVIASIFGIPGFLSFAPQLSDLATLKQDVEDELNKLAATLNSAENIQGFVNYDPLEKIMRTPSSFFAPLQQNSGIKLRLAMVALEDGALRYVTETNTMIERDGRRTEVPPPPTAADIAKLNAQRQQLIDAIGDLTPGPDEGHAGQTRKPDPRLLNLKRKLAQLNEKLARLSVPMDLIRAAIASSSLPVICRPTTMQDGFTYIDGGIRTLAPIQSAVDAGASQVYAIAAGSFKFDAKSMEDIAGGAPLPLLGIALRVGEQILPDEVGRRDLFPANPWPVPVVVIQPDPSLDDIHDGLTIEPGLIRIRMAYGFMRAYDAVKAFEKFGPGSYLKAAQENSTKAKTSEIIQLRKQIWDLEFPANGKKFVMPDAPLPPAPYTVQNLPARDANAENQLRLLKQQLKTLVNARIAYYADAARNLDGTESLPADFRDWWRNWEAHSWTPPQPFLRMKTTISPGAITLNVQTSFTVQAWDEESGAPILDAIVKVDGVPVGVTGQEHKWIFKATTDDVPNSKGHPINVSEPPEITVSKSGYQNAVIQAAFKLGPANALA